MCTAWRHYCSDGYDDAGWGCVYRSAQNAILACGGAPPTVADMREVLRPSETRSRRLWIEPGELLPVLPAGLEYYRLALPGPGMQCTGVEDYDEVFAGANAAARAAVHRVERAGRGGIVLDDGVMGRAAVLCDTWLLVDPHSTAAPRVEELGSADRAVQRIAALHPHTLMAAALTPS